MDVLLYLVFKKFGFLDDEIKMMDIQAKIHILQALGFSLGYRFTKWFEFSQPYSKELSEDVVRIRNQKEIYSNTSTKLNSKIEKAIDFINELPKPYEKISNLVYYIERSKNV